MVWDHTEETQQTKQKEQAFLNIQREFRIPRSCCHRLEGGKESENWGKSSFPCSPHRLGTIINI